MLSVLYVTVCIAATGAWFAVRFTGKYPRGTFDYVEGTTRWNNRAVGYAFILAMDAPFP